MDAPRHGGHLVAQIIKREGIPNLFTLSRLPLSVVLFACIAYELWLAALLVFGLAALTDWLDGLLARWEELEAKR